MRAYATASAALIFTTRAGNLEFLAGKQELLRLGYLDDVDLAKMIEANSSAKEGQDRDSRFEQRARRQEGALHRSRFACRGFSRQRSNALYAARVALAVPPLRYDCDGAAASPTRSFFISLSSVNADARSEPAAKNPGTSRGLRDRVRPCRPRSCTAPNAR
jgi:hypothetical protein